MHCGTPQGVTAVHPRGVLVCTPRFSVVLLRPLLLLVVDNITVRCLFAPLAILINQCCCLSVRVCFNPARKSFHPPFFHQMFDGVIHCAGGFVTQCACQCFPPWMLQAAVPICIHHERVINSNGHGVFYIFKKRMMDACKQLPCEMNVVVVLCVLDVHCCPPIAVEDKLLIKYMNKPLSRLGFPRCVRQHCRGYLIA